MCFGKLGANVLPGKRTVQQRVFVLFWGILFNKMNNKFQYWRREEKHNHRLSSRLENTLLLFSYFHVRIEALLLNLITNNLFGLFF